MTKKASFGNDIIAKLRGTAVVYADRSFDFRPDKESDKPLYNDILAESKSGSVKLTDKSAVLRLVADAKSPELRTELMRKSLELIGKLPDEASEALVLPDYRELVGETNHGKVFLSKDQILVQIALRFDEPNPKIAELLDHASPEQMAYIKQHIDPTAIFQAEVAAICLLLANCQDQHERDSKLLNFKQKRKEK